MDRDDRVDNEQYASDYFEPTVGNVALPDQPDADAESSDLEQRDDHLLALRDLPAGVSEPSTPSPVFREKNSSNPHER